jgi:hypothetical protein
LSCGYGRHSRRANPMSRSIRNRNSRLPTLCLRLLTRFSVLGGDQSWPAVTPLFAVRRASTPAHARELFEPAPYHRAQETWSCADDHMDGIGVAQIHVQPVHHKHVVSIPIPFHT